MSTTLTYAKKLKIIRVHLACSQPEFARMIGVSFPTVRNWEQPSRGLPAPTAQALIDVFYADPRQALHQLQCARSKSKQEQTS